MTSLDVKKEEDIKLYHEKLGKEYRLQCYNENRPDGCHQLGEFLEAVKEDFQKAAGIYKINCDENKFGKSCYKYGSCLLVGKGCKSNLNESYSYFWKGCFYGNPESCYAAGRLHTFDIQNQEKDFKKAVDLFDKGCNGNDARSCFHASSILLKGLGNVPQDCGRAFEYAKRACDLKHVQSCANLSQMYRQGDGVAKNDDLAKKYKKIALDMHEKSKRGLPPLIFS